MRRDPHFANRPATEHGFALHKGAFHDALALHQTDFLRNASAVPLFQLNTLCPVPKVAFHRSGTMRYEVCNDVCIEPELLPVTDEELTGSTANSQAGAHLDIAANGVWGGTFERTDFDVRVFNPHDPSNRHTDLQSVYK